MSTNLRFWIALPIHCFISLLPLAAQEASTDSVRLNQPVPITIRMSNNAIVKGALVAMDQNGISIFNQQGRTVDYTFNKVRSFRNQDGSIFFTPAKDTASDLIGRLNALQPAATANTAGQAAANSLPTGGHGQMPAAPVYAAPPPFQASAHNQSHVPTYNPPPPVTPSTSHSHTPYTPPPNPYTPSASHSPHTAHTPYTPPPMHNPMHNQMPPPPPMPPMGHGPGNQMGQQLVWEYTCTNCQYKFESTTEVKAGHRCSKCGVVWGEIHDQNGRTVSSSPAAKVGGGIGGLALIVGIIVAIVRKVQSE